MTGTSPAARLEARANREHTKLLKASDELHIIAGIIKHCDTLPADMKLRLIGALRAEETLLAGDRDRIAGLRKAAEISRGRQWITSGDQ